MSKPRVSPGQFDHEKIKSELSTEKEGIIENREFLGASAVIKQQGNFFNRALDLAQKTFYKQGMIDSREEQMDSRDHISLSVDRDGNYNNETINKLGTKEKFGATELETAVDPVTKKNILAGATVKIVPPKLGQLRFMRVPNGPEDIKTENENTESLIKYIKNYETPYISSDDVPEVKQSLMNNIGRYVLLNQGDEMFKVLIVSKKGDIAEVDFLLRPTFTTKDLEKTLKERMKTAGYVDVSTDTSNVISMAIDQYKKNRENSEQAKRAEKTEK